MKKVRQWRQSLRPSAPRDPAPLAPESNDTILQSRGAPTPVFPDGVKLLQDCPDAAIDICFVHGLTGNRDNTWTADGDSTPWPKKLLSPKLPQARILTYGYDASVVSKRVTSQNRLIDHATNLLSDLTNDRECANASSRPLVFVAHSLGGLVCKKAVLLSRNNAEPHLRGIFECLKGIVFMGTPHKGSWMADWSTIPASAFGLVKSTNVMLLDILQQDNQLLESIQVDFLAMIRGLRESGRRIEVTCFFEELPLPIVGKVVSKDSATLEGYTPLSIHANHSNMVKFASAGDNGFKRLLGELTRWTAQLGQLDQYYLTAEDRACLYDLQTTDPRDDKARIENTKGGLLRDSYRWVLENQEFREWISTEKPGELLWIKGDPGKGKTMLICGIIDELMAHSQGTISYFFCQATDTRLNTSVAVLRGLIYLLIVKQPSLISHVRARYDHSGKRLFEGINAWDAMSKIFTAILKDSTSIYLVIDALDECVIGQPQLLDFLTQNSMAYPHVKWIVSGRNLPEIEETLNTIPQKTRLWLEINEKSVSQAVDIFIHHKIQKLTDLKKYNQETQNAVMSHLLENARGTFLWVALVCQKLAETPRLSTLQRLRTFPPGLDAIYQQMMDQVNGRDESRLCKQVLAVASIAYRPITLQELTTLIDVDIPSDLAANDLDSLADIIGYCGSFLTISNHAVFFVHQSAKDFLLKNASAEILPDGLAAAHHRVFSQSLQVLEKTLRPDIYTLEAPGVSVSEAQAKKPRPDPLAEVQYSCVYWIDHLICYSFDRPTNANARDCDMISVFLTQKYLYWLEALSLLSSIPQGLVAMTKLEGVLLRNCQVTSSLLDRVADASRFLRYHKRVIESSPLQLYSSCLMFSPIDSPTRSSFRIHVPDWVTMKPAVTRWDPCLQTLEDHSDVITSLSRSFYDRRLVSSSRDSTIRFWDLVAGQCILTLEGHTNGVTSIAWSHGDQELASSSRDKTIKIWNSATGCCLATLYGHDCSVISIHWSQDGKKLISTSLDSSVKVWDRVSGKCIFTLHSICERFSLELFLESKTQLIVTLKGGSMVLWDLNTGSSVATLQGHCSRVNDLVSYHNETRLVSAAENIKIWDLSNGRELATLDGHSEYVDCISLSPDGMRLASGSKDNTINIWDLSSYKRFAVLKGHSKEVNRLLWFSDDNLASASSDNSIKIWDVDSGKPVSTFQCYGVSTLEISHDGERLISGSGDSTIKVWDLKNLTGENHSREFSSVHWSRDGQFLASVASSVINIWNPSTGESISALEGHRGSIYSVAWSRDHRLAVTTADHKVRVWDVFSARCIWTLDADTTIISTLCWSEDETRLTVNPNPDGVGMILDSTTGQCVSTFQSNFTCPPNFWSPDGTLFAVVLANTIAIYDTLTGEHVSTLQGRRGECDNEHLSGNNMGIVITQDGNPSDNDRPTSICWARDGIRLASASEQSIKIWNIRTGHCILTLKTGRDAGKLRFAGDFSFEEPNDNWLHTQMGWFDIESYLALPANRLIPSSKPIGMGLSRDETWIKHGDKNILWLPPEFRPSPGLREGVLFQPLAVSGTTLAIGCVSGQVRFLDFSKEIACS